ncbi:hypothetical protein AB0T83_07065 [Fluviibacterium sp. DFM31]|uniref:DUF4760 domain-containing protein n=1 Tax=Meridianimarinicoccus marinus TaxID=3231483 RepID=A0ABV3L4U1_9RHOB
MGILPLLTLILGVFSGLIIATGAPDWLSELAWQKGYFTTEAMQLLLIAAVLTQARRIRTGGQENHKRETRIATLDFIASVWGYYDTSRIALERKFPKSVVLLEELTKEDKEHVDVLLNTMNIVAAGIRHDALNRSVITDVYGRHYLAVNQKYAAYVAERAQRARTDPWPHLTWFLGELGKSVGAKA